MGDETLETRVTVLEMKMDDVVDSVKWTMRSAVTTACAACGILLGIVFQVMHK